MFKIEETPFYLWLAFCVLYFAIGNSADPTWSGAFFCMNYILIMWAFIVHKTKRIKFVGVSLSFSLFLFSIIKFFVYPKIEKECIFALFIIVVSLKIYLQKRK